MIGKFFDWVGMPRKLGFYLLSVATTVAVAALKSAKPEWPLPSPDSLLASGAGLIAAHAATDIVALRSGASARGSKPAKLDAYGLPVFGAATEAEKAAARGRP
jgi:hypothetical protein